MFYITPPLLPPPPPQVTNLHIILRRPMKLSINRTNIPTVYMAIQDLLEPDINQNITHP